MRKFFFVFVCFLFATTLTAANMLVKVSDDTETCANGGKKIEVVSDVNGNGQIDFDADGQIDTTKDKIEQTEYVCNGENGATAISVTEDPTECPAGGFKVIVNVNGQNNDFFACNGEKGDDAFVETSTFNGSAGHCTNGGVKIESGKNGTVSKTDYVCNGEKGEPGQNGNNALVKTSDAETTKCKNGGVKIEVYIDKNNNGEIDDEDEIVADQTKYICNGAKGNPGTTGETGPKGEDGQDGEDGPKGDQGPKGDTGAKGDQGTPGAAGANGENGKDGAASLVAIADEPKGQNCTSGGKKISVGLDSNRNGILDESEIDTNNIYYVCNGNDAEETELTSSSTGCSLNTVDGDGSFISAVFAVLAAICALFGLKIAR